MVKKKNNKKKNKKGFTLVELIATIAIVAVIATIAVTAFTGIAKRTKEKEYEAVVGSIKAAAYNFYDATRLNKFYVQTLIDYGLLSTDTNRDVIINPKDNESMNCYIIDINEEEFSLTENDNCAIDIYSATKPIIKICNTNDTFDPTVWHNYTSLCLEPKLPDEITSQGIHIKSARWEDEKNAENYSSDSKLRLTFNANKDEQYRYKLILKLDNENISVLNTKIDIKNDLTEPNITVEGGANCGNGLPVNIKYTDTGSGLSKVIFDGEEITSFTNVHEYIKKYNLYETRSYTIDAIDNAGNRYSGNKTINLSQNENAFGVSINVTNTSGKIVQSNKWSTEGLSFKLNANWGSEDCTGNIYYCVDENNSCTPNIETTNDTVITDYVANTGTFYIRYNAINKGNRNTGVNTFIAKVDPFYPFCANGSNTYWTKGVVELTYGCLTVGESGCYIVGIGTDFSIKSFSDSGKTAVLPYYDIKSNAGLGVACNPREVNVYIDKEKPSINGIPQITPVTSTVISIEVSASDAHSGIKYLRYKINGDDGGRTEFAAIDSSKNQYPLDVNHIETFDLTRFKMGSAFDIVITAEDAVGNQYSVERTFVPTSTPAQSTVGIPTITMTSNGAVYTSDKWTNKPVKLQITHGTYKNYVHSGYKIEYLSNSTLLPDNLGSSYTVSDESPTRDGYKVGVTDYGKSSLNSSTSMSSGVATATVKIDKTPPVYNNDFDISSSNLFAVVQCWQAGSVDDYHTNIDPLYGAFDFSTKSISVSGCGPTKRVNDDGTINYNPESLENRYMYIHYPISMEIDKQSHEIITHFCQFADRVSNYYTYFNGGTFEDNSPYYDALSGISKSGISKQTIGNEKKSYYNDKPHCGKTGAPCLMQYQHSVSDIAGNSMNGYKITMVTHYYEVRSSTTPNEWDPGREGDRTPDFNDKYTLDCRNISSYSGTMILGKKEVCKDRETKKETIDGKTYNVCKQWVTTGYCVNEQCSKDPYYSFPLKTAP